MGKPKPRNKTRKVLGKSKTVYINEKVLDEIEKDSIEENRSVSFIVNNILQKYYVAEKRIED